MRKYDFQNWETRGLSGEMREATNALVRENLRRAFNEFGNGEWRTAFDYSSVKWMSNWDDDPVVIELSPNDLRDALLQDVAESLSKNWTLRNAEGRKDARKVIEMIEAWASEINEVLTVAREALALSSTDASAPMK